MKNIEKTIENICETVLNDYEYFDSMFQETKMETNEFKYYCKCPNDEHPDLISKWETSQNLMNRAYAEIVKELAGAAA
ncbi:MAG: hypothetical protein PWQ63_17 [Methanolobus sp.]|jgi:hypothetical protein|nr:hypothetical protein [Methanolobus sp.]MDK2946857.1 hypothetical protein [Methanolobus sp.]